MLLSALLVAAPVAALPTPDPTELLDAAARSIAAVGSASYRARQFVLGVARYGELAAILSPTIGRVRAERSAAGPGVGRLHVDGRVLRTAAGSRDVPFVVSRQGSRLWRLEPTAGRLVVGEGDGASALLLGADDLLLHELFAAEPLAAALAADVVEYEGVAVVGDVACHVVRADAGRGADATSERWYLGLDDRLPRRVERRFRQANEHTSVLELQDLVVSSGPSDGSFVLEAPAGFEVVHHDAADASSARAGGAGIELGRPAPDFTLRDVTGGELALTGLRGRVVVLDFWATWCAPCRAALPELQELHEELGEDGLVLGLTTWDAADPAEVGAVAKVDYPLLVDADEVARAYGVDGLPTVIVIDRQGVIRFTGRGAEAFRGAQDVARELR